MHYVSIKHGRWLSARRWALTGVTHWREHDLVFPTAAGTLTRCQSFISRLYRPLQVKAGVPPVRCHDLRHTSATLLIESGVLLPIMSDILGHSMTRIAGDLCTHVSLAMQQQAMDSIDNLLGA
jgi:integrase